MKKGIWYAFGAYTLWGLFPIYWKFLHHVPAIQLIGHRIFWSFITLFIFILFLKKWDAFRHAVFKNRILKNYSIAALLIGINWLTYVWAVNSGHIIEASLGYFINPLISVILGVMFLHEKIRRWQWLPIGLAAAGVLFLTASFGSVPWIALALALSFGLYGLVKKISPLGSLYGLTIETGILFVPAMLFLSYCDFINEGAFLHTGPISDVLMIFTGLVTSVPLLMFASATRRIPLTLIGILQYISPTLQFLIGIIIYNEPFSNYQLAGYSIVWVALIIFALEGYFSYRTRSFVATIE
jgi:chloramphenicol-sensitive protein RarD